VASLLFVGTYAFGGLALRDFALALFVGLLTGAYSSIFVATPVLAVLKERQPRYRALRERAAADLAKAAVVVPVPPVVAGEPADVPVDGEDVDFGGELDDEVPAAPTPAPRATPVPAPASVPVAAPAPSGATRGAANPRGRQQRSKKKKR
jgi:preprotein translocase subunit SecF